jgi:spermidine/putrescine transport system substrate-binding protein
MKKIIKLLSLSICIAIMGILLVGCSKKTTEEINFLNYGENIDKESVKEFEKEYGIKVNIETFDDMETMYQKVSSGG